MAVIPEARGLGIGRLLLQEVAQLAQDNNAEKLYLSTTPFLHSAISLYRRFGFVETADGPHDLFGTPLFTMEKKIV
jgi:ribosomal protein S18 acetylase RimI-like enzyme